MASAIEDNEEFSVYFLGLNSFHFFNKATCKGSLCFLIPAPYFLAANQ